MNCEFTNIKTNLHHVLASIENSHIYTWEKPQELATRVGKTVALPFYLTTKPTKLTLANSPRRRRFTHTKQTKSDASPTPLAAKSTSINPLNRNFLGELPTTKKELNVHMQPMFNDFLLFFFSAKF